MGLCLWSIAGPIPSWHTPLPDSWENQNSGPVKPVSGRCLSASLAWETHCHGVLQRPKDVARLKTQTGGRDGDQKGQELYLSL